MTSFPRDGGEQEPQELIEAESRHRGRAVPEREEPEILIHIVINGLIFGTVDVTTLKAKAQFDLEDVTGAYDLLGWLEKYAGVEEADLPAIRDELGEMSIQAIVDLALEISSAIGRALSVPKTNKPAWRSRSSTVQTRRSGR